MPNKINIEEVMRRLPPFVKIIPETYKGIRYSADFIDIEYEQKFTANVSSLINLQHGCSKRSNDLRSKTNTEKFKGKSGKEVMILINDVRSKLPHFLEIDEQSYKGVRYKAKFYDNEYKIWFEALPANMMKGKGFCKKRQYDNNKIKGIIPLEEVQQRLEDKFNDRYIIIPETYKSISEKASFIREDGATIQVTPQILLSGRIDIRRDLEKWRFKVLVRDDWNCQKCGSTENSVAHHIKPFHAFPEGRLDPKNGATLCRKCHELYHALYKNEETVENFNYFLQN
jgi:hypothetical protein